MDAALQQPGRPVYGPTYTPTAPPPQAAVSLAVQADENLISITKLVLKKK